MNAESITFEKLQREVVEGNQQLDLIFNSLPQSLALVNPNFEIQRVNSHFLSLYGVKNEDVIGKRCFEACFGLETVCDGCLVEKALKSKKTEKKIKSFPSGEICEMTAQPVLNQSGEVTHVLDMRTNITELVEKERELQRIQFAMDQSSDEFWLFDKAWNIVYASKSASKNLSYPIHEIKGSNIEKFNMLHRIENLSALFERVKKKNNIRIESIQFERDGSTYPCEMNLSYFDDQGEFIYAVGEMISSPRIQEYIMWIAPKEKAGLYMGTNFLAVFLGAVLSGLYTGTMGKFEVAGHPEYIMYTLAIHSLVGIFAIWLYTKLVGSYKEREE